MTAPSAGGAAVAVFAKAPTAGRVKTRLIPPLSPEEAARVARALLEDTLHRFPAAIAAPFTLFLDGEADEALGEAAARAGVAIRPQGTGDLGARLARAFAALREGGAERVVAIGSDSPTLDPARIAEALEALRSGDAALGPTEDGGYYLIGARRGEADLFRDVPWSTARVARVTRERARGSGLSLRLLSPWYDVDDAESLRRAARDATPGRCPALARVLVELGDRIGV